MKLTFRFASSDDNIIFHNLLLNDKNKTMRQLGISGMDLDHFSPSDYKATFVAMLEDNTMVAFAKVTGGGIAGFNYVATFYVRSKFRRQGVGTKLLEFVENYAKNTWQAAGINLYTIDNPPMDALVKKMDFKLSGILKRDYCINGKFYNTSRWYKLYKK